MDMFHRMAGKKGAEGEGRHAVGFVQTAEVPELKVETHGGQAIKAICKFRVMLTHEAT